jgi:hypothetical protein
LVIVGGVLDLGRGVHVELAVEPAVVPPPDPFERGELDLLDGAPRAALADQLGLVEPVGRLGALSLESLTVPADGSALSSAIQPV